MPDIGVVAALPGEAATWETGGRGPDRFRIVAAGVGIQRAARAADALLAAGAGLLVSWGVAGGLLATLQPGNLVLPDRVASADGEAVPDPAWRERLAQALAQAGMDVTSGGLWSHARAVTSVHEKRQLAAHGCVAVDMEAAAVARAARRAGVPFVAVKSICDPAGRALPVEAARWLRADGRVRVTAVAAALARGPGMWRQLYRMHSDFDAARASLRRAAGVVRLSCPA